MSFELYERLVELDRQVAETWKPVSLTSPHRDLLAALQAGCPLSQSGLCLIGLTLNKHLDPLAEPNENDGRYSWCTPTNAVPFAWTGASGIHYSFLITSGGLDVEHAPIVGTFPNCMGHSYILGENLLDFLRLGCMRGFCELENLLVEGDAEFWQSEDVECLMPHQRTQHSILKLFRDAFRLAPWSKPNVHFHWLQDRYARLITFPANFGNQPDHIYSTSTFDTF